MNQTGPAAHAGTGGHAGEESTGFLIAIDGQSGVGKTTVTALAGARVTGHGFSVLVTGQPSDSPMGKLARASTHDLHGLPLSFLMAADRHHHQDHVIAPALSTGQVVLCDRYVTTALVLDQLDGADPEFIWGMYRYMRWPDLAVILTGDPLLCRMRAQARGVYSRFHQGGARTAQAEAALYTTTAGMLAGYGYPVQTVPIGDRTAEQVADTVTALIRDRVRAVRAEREEGDPR